ncbi:thymus-specific serine protease [Emydura macquarii macquarii]|uniref:thymus-specific serine protease n=1 Tax=Emydura macquarii macquarii TaxID=1129001 RepID=UPI00352B4443
MGHLVPRVLGLFLSLLILAEAARNFQLLQQRVLQWREVQAMKETLSRRQLLLPAPWRAPSEGVLRQPLDHFNRQEGRAFNQRFWINEEYWHRPAGPVFLYIGGESALSQFSVLSGHHMEMAEKYGALAVALEHRFYGASINPDGLRDDSLRFLSSQQALADLASFHLFVTQKYNLTQNNTWICFGGSYPGSLAAWFRLKFPHLVFAAVASSAPVQAQLDFTGYNQVVAASLSDPVVGGSAQCREAVAQAFSAVDQRLRAGQLAELEKDFHSCGNLTEPHDREQLTSNLADIFMGAVQYNNEGFQGGSVASLCTIMINGDLGSPYQRLIAVNNDFLEAMAFPCMENSHQRLMAELRSTNLSLTGVGERQWYFQTCTEFGYYQTCEDSTCPFSRLMTLSSQLDLCTQVFGVAPERVAEAVTFTNEYYGADHPKASRILFVNGDIDPWHALSVLTNQSRSELAILINGTSHCANMNPSKKSDPRPLILAREWIDYHVGDWLRLARKAPSAS